MAQQLKSIEILRKVCSGTFSFEDEWLEINLTSGIGLKSPLAFKYVEMGNYYKNPTFNAFYNQIYPGKVAFSRESLDVNNQPCFGVNLYPLLTLIFCSDKPERKAFIQELEARVQKAGFPNFKIL